MRFDYICEYEVISSVASEYHCNVYHCIRIVVDGTLFPLFHILKIFDSAVGTDVGFRINSDIHTMIKQVKS